MADEPEVDHSSLEEWAERLGLSGATDDKVFNAGGLFEKAFQDFLTDGGFDQQCLNEAYDRTRRTVIEANAPKHKDVCPHGKYRMLCSECYFQ